MAVAGRPGIGNISSHWQQEIPAPSTSSCSLSPSPRCFSSSLRIASPPRHGKQVVLLGWGSAFVSCKLGTSPGQKIVTRRRRALRIVSESMDENDHDNEVRTFLSSFPEAGEVDVSGHVQKPKPFWTWNLFQLLDRIAEHADAQTEMGMKRRLAYYKAEDWTAHRSSKRHLRHVMSTFKSRVIIALIPPVTALTSIAAVVAVYNTLVEESVLPSYFPILHSSSEPYQLIAPALALLLVFRTEASYERYDEGRKTWTRMFSCTKDLSRQCLAWIQSPHDFHRRIDLLHYILAFPVALKCHLLDGSSVYDDLKLLLDEEDLAVVMKSQHRPNCLIQLMTQSLGLVHLNDSQRSLMDANISQFNDGVSVCERIIRSPIPLSYTRLTSRALILWHLTLPLVLWDDCKLMLIFAVFVSASTLFCIEEVGVLIEEPFPMLALDKMCAVAHQSVQELMATASVTDMYLKTKEKKLRSSAVTGTGAFARVSSNGVLQSSSK